LVSLFVRLFKNLLAQEVVISLGPSMTSWSALSITGQPLLAADLGPWPSVDPLLLLAALLRKRT
jgi:hypothetical protein